MSLKPGAKHYKHCLAKTRKNYSTPMLVLRYDLWFRYSFNLRDFSSISTSAPAMAETTNGTAAEAPADAGEKLRSIVRSNRKLGGSRFPPKFVGTPKYNQKSLHVVSHRIHGTGIFIYIWLILMVNVGKYTSPMDPMGLQSSDICCVLRHVIQHQWWIASKEFNPLFLTTKGSAIKWREGASNGFEAMQVIKMFELEAQSFMISTWSASSRVSRGGNNDHQNGYPFLIEDPL